MDKVRAVISDIHGNLEALKAVLTDIEYQGIKEIVCLGDIVGYGPDPIECIELTQKRCQTVLFGNHDMAVLSQPFGFNKYARQAIEWTRKQLKPGLLSLPATRARWEYLKTRPMRYEEEDGNLLFVHASPRDPVMEYLEESDLMNVGFGPGNKIIENFEIVKRVAFIGHSHKPGIFTYNVEKDDYGYIHLWDLEDLRYELPEKGKGKSIINVGSVGQPRDEDPRACYILLEGKSVSYRRVFYDVTRTKAKIKVVEELDEALAERLEAGI